MDRRRFIELCATGAAGALATGWLAGCGRPAPADTGPALPRRVPGSFATARDAELDVTLRVLSGTLPGDLHGHAFVLAPMPRAPGVPSFNGEGMTLRLSFADGRVALRSKLNRPPCYWADQAAAGTRHAFVDAGIVRLSPTLGFRSPLNTAFCVMGSRLLLTVDAGRPYELDPASLELVTPVGALSEWRTQLPPDLLRGAPFILALTTAHPVYDEHAREWLSVNLATGPSGFTDVLKWDGAGPLARWAVRLPDGTPLRLAQSAHQIAATRDWLVIADTAFLIEPDQIFGIDVSRAQAPESALYLVRRADLRAGATEVTARRVVLPDEVVHLTADYDDAGGRITLHVAHIPSLDASEWIRADDVRADTGEAVRADLRGMLPGAADLSALGRHVIDADAGALVPGESVVVRDDARTWGLSLYAHRGAAPPGRLGSIFWLAGGYSEETMTRRVVELYRDHPRRTVPIDQLPRDGRPTVLLRFDPRAGRIADAYRFPDGRGGQSPQFIPRAGRGGELEGYVLCAVASDDRSHPDSTGDEFWLFDAAELSRGPLCRLGHRELDLPFTLHTAWMPEAAPARRAYRIDARADYAAALSAASPEVRALLETAVLPHFDAT